MSRYPLLYTCVAGVLLTAALAAYSNAWSSAIAHRSADRCGDQNDASAFVCRNTWMAHLKTSYR